MNELDRLIDGIVEVNNLSKELDKQKEALEEAIEWCEELR